MSQTYRSPLSSLVAAALFALAPAIAQGPIAPASIAPGTASRPDVASLRSSAHGLTEAADGLRGFGADYGVAFTTSGMTFTPALGAQAPTDQRLQMAVIGITRGATSIPCAAVAPQQQGNAVVYARAAGLEERYEVRSEGVEQSFVFHELPGRGDLVVHCALGGELAARGEMTAEGEVQFVVPGLGGATIGTVTGIDARGARCTGSLRLGGGGVDLVLPAGFVDHATLPLVLDPLVGTRVDFATGPTDDTDPDTAYDATTQQFCVVWTRTSSATSGQVYARAYHQTNGLGPTLLLASDTVVRHARIASHHASNRFLVAWERADGAIANSTLRACTIDSGFVVGTTVTVTTAGHCTDPDLSGNPGSTAADLGGLLVFREHGVGIQCAVCTVPIGTQPVTFQAPTAVQLDPNVGPARISKAGNGTRMVAFEIPGWVLARPVGANGAVVGAGWQAAIPGTRALAADVDGQGSSFVVVAEQEPSAGNRDLVAHQLQLAGTVLTRTANGAVAATAADEAQPAVALLGPKYLVAWTRTVGFLDSVVAVRSFAVDGCVACGLEAQLSGTLQTEMRPAIGSRLSGGIAAPGALIVCASHAAASPFQGDVTGAMFTAFAATTTSTLWNGCGNPVSLALVGTLSLGNASFAFRTTTTDPQAGLAIFGFGFGGTPLQCGTCTFVDPVALVFVGLSAGAATHALPVPCNTGLIGIALDAETAVLGATTNQCPLLPMASLSPALRCTFGE